MRLIQGLMLMWGSFWSFWAACVIIKMLISSIKEKSLYLNDLKDILNVIKSKNKIFKKCIMFFTIISIVFAVTYFGGASNECIGSLYEKYEYETKYYVYARPSTSITKNYKLIADIRIQNDKCFIDKAYFPNTGYLYFGDWQIDLDKENHMVDQNDKEWYVILTNEKVDEDAPNEVKP